MMYIDTIIKLPTNMILHKMVKWAAAVILLSLPSTAFAVSSSDFTRLEGVSAGDQFGRSVASGDINGDGYDDLITGAAASATGYISIVYGSETLPSDTTLSTSNSAIITGNGSSDFFGVGIAVGDIDGDGYDDVAVGATGDTSAGAANSGAVYLLYGSVSGIDSGAVADNSAVAKFTNGIGFFTGSSVSIGNIDGDEYDDLLIGSRNDAATGGSVSIVYGQEVDYNGLSNSIASLPKFTGESNGNSFGATSAVGDINNDGFDDVVIGAQFNNDGATAAGATYVFYGQETDYTGSTSASDVAEFTGEATGDNSGTTVATGDVSGDGFDDILITAPGSDDGASEAGAVYLVPGNSTAFSATETSLNTMTELTGVTAGDAIDRVDAVDVTGDGVDEIIASSRVTTENAGAVYVIDGDSSSGSMSSGLTITGADTEKFGSAIGGADVNDDGFLELLVGAQGYSSSIGSLSIGVMLLDADGDGVAGSGLIVDTDESFIEDCNDSDESVSTYQTYYIDSDGDGLGDAGTTTTACSSTAPDGYSSNDSDTNDTIPNNNVEIDGDGIDNDGDSITDEANTLEENGAHPYYGTLDPADTDTVASAITDVASTSEGMVAVTYSDNSVYNYAVFSTISSPVKVERYKTTGLAPVLHPKGKKIALLNILSGEVVKTITLSTAHAYSQNSLKLLDVRKDGSLDVVTTSRKNSRVLVGVLKLKVSTQKLTKKDTIKLSNKKVSPNKTKVKGKTILLRSKKGKTLFILKVNKKYKFVE